MLTSAILTQGERERPRRAARIMSKSDVSGSALAGAISDALGGLLLEARERVTARLCSFSPTPTELRVKVGAEAAISPSDANR